MRVDAANKKKIRKEWEELYGGFPLESLPWHSERPAKALINAVSEAAVTRGRALDICAGAGTNAAYLSAKGFSVSAVDISCSALRLAGERIRKKRQRCGLVVADAARLPFRDSAFDFIFDRGCFHHMPPEERQVFIEGLHRCLKARGKYLLICFSDKNPLRENTFSRRDLRDYFSASFNIDLIKESVFYEFKKMPRYFYAAFMRKRRQ